MREETRLKLLVLLGLFTLLAVAQDLETTEVTSAYPETEIQVSTESNEPWDTTSEDSGAISTNDNDLLNNTHEASTPSNEAADVKGIILPYGKDLGEGKQQEVEGFNGNGETGDEATDGIHREEEAAGLNGKVTNGKTEVDEDFERGERQATEETTGSRNLGRGEGEVTEEAEGREESGRSNREVTEQGEESDNYGKSDREVTDETEGGVDDFGGNEREVTEETESGDDFGRSEREVTEETEGGDDFARSEREVTEETEGGEDFKGSGQKVTVETAVGEDTGTGEKEATDEAESRQAEPTEGSDVVAETSDDGEITEEGASNGREDQGVTQQEIDSGDERASERTGRSNLNEDDLTERTEGDGGDERVPNGVEVEGDEGGGEEAQERAERSDGDEGGVTEGAIGNEDEGGGERGVTAGDEGSGGVTLPEGGQEVLESAGEEMEGSSKNEDAGGVTEGVMEGEKEENDAGGILEGTKEGEKVVTEGAQGDGNVMESEIIVTEPVKEVGNAGGSEGAVTEGAEGGGVTEAGVVEGAEGDEDAVGNEGGIAEEADKGEEGEKVKEGVEGGEGGLTEESTGSNEKEGESEGVTEDVQAGAGDDQITEGSEGGGNEAEDVAQETATEKGDIETIVAGYGDPNETLGNNTLVTDGGSAVEKVTTTTTRPVIKATTTTAKPTTKKRRCGKNAVAVQDSCICKPGWIRDPTQPSSSTSPTCLCPDLCNGPNSLTCPSGSQCYHMTCNMASCKCLDNKYYDPVSKSCQDPCTFFGNALCGLVSKRVCQVSDSIEEGYSCPCASGYILVDDVCVDENECETSQPCGENEQCVNVVGSYKCPCMAGFMRSESGTCVNVNECLNPRLHDCNHMCEDATPGYTCQCYPGYSWSDVLRRCELDDESASCDCSDPKRSICYQPEEGDQECYPIPGFTLSNGSYIDIQECSEKVDQWCSFRGTCTEGVGSSVCKCDIGYVNDTLNYGQCIEIQCPAGTVLSGSDCVSPCSLIDCPSPMRCVVGSSGTGECVCGTMCQGLLQTKASTSIYYGSLVVTTPSGGEDTASKVTEVLKAYFGKDNVEVLDVETQRNNKTRIKKRSTKTLTNLLVEFVVMTDQPNITNEVTEVIQSQCQSSNSAPPGTCIFPGGLVVKEDSISVETKDPCLSNNPCPSDLFECNPRKDLTGRFTCTCIKGYTKIDVEGTPGYCQDIDECSSFSQICKSNEECINTPGSSICRVKGRTYLPERAFRDLAIAFGVLFAVTLLVALYLIYMLLKRNHRVQELVPMTETSSGFENHGYHK